MLASFGSYPVGDSTSDFVDFSPKMMPEMSQLLSESNQSITLFREPL